MLYPQNMNIAVGKGKIRKLWIFLSFFFGEWRQRWWQEECQKSNRFSSGYFIPMKIGHLLKHENLEMISAYPRLLACTNCQGGAVETLQGRGQRSPRHAACVRVFLGEMLTSSPRGMQWSCSSKKSLIKFLLFDLWQIILKNIFF